jgi:phospholipase/lecithinase/hemolysin
MARPPGMSLGVLDRRDEPQRMPDGRHSATRCGAVRSAGMATLSSLTNGFDAATHTISADLTGAAASAMSFLGQDPLTVPAGGYNSIYAFGDSLSDVGNVAIGTARMVPVSPPYFEGHFTNGDVWVQDLAADLGVQSPKASLAGGTDYAYGGAETGATPLHANNPTDLNSQVGQFVASGNSPAPNSLFTMWIGTNDVLDVIGNKTLTPEQQSADLQTAVNNEVGALTTLSQHGAQNFVVLNVTDLGKTPYEMARGPAEAASASALSAQYNADLSNSIQALVAQTGVKVDLVDTYSMLDGLIANPAQYSFTNATQPIWTGNLTDPNSGTLVPAAAQNGYVFFDDLHPSAATHAALASTIVHGVAPPVA